RLEAEEDMAYQVGQELINRLNTMTSLTKAKLEQKTQSSLKEIAEMKILLFILIALGPLLAIGLAIFFIKGFTQPLNILLHATRKLKSGDLSFRIQGLKDEFGEVGASFNEMAGSLKEQMHKMQRAEQMTTFGQMAAGLVHEIKNPLAGIKAAIELMAEEIALSAENKDILSKVISEIRRIEALMKSLLDFARPPKPQFMQVNLNHILEGTLNFLIHQPSFSQSKKEPIAIIQNLDVHLPEIVADPQQLRQIFINLLLNAHEAMAHEGTVTVKTSLDSSDMIEVSFSDAGKGMNKDIIEKIFQPFFTTKPKGTGLGLAISKQLIEQHGGTISAENNPDGGATFRIKIPIAQPERISG
ncbi:MAG: ATP-binding protein, partial [Chloroflexota bacterium]|nr:ATP-binding protein [Chloroflexota bacterium]